MDVHKPQNNYIFKKKMDKPQKTLKNLKKNELIKHRYNIINSFSNQRHDQHKNQGCDSGKGRQWGNDADALHNGCCQEVKIGHSHKLQKQAFREKIYDVVFGCFDAVRMKF